MADVKSKLEELLKNGKPMSFNELMKNYKLRFGEDIPYKKPLKSFLINLGFDCGKQSVKLGFTDPKQIGNLSILFSENGTIQLGHVVSKYTERFGVLQYGRDLKSFLLENGFEADANDNFRLPVSDPIVAERLRKILADHPDVRNINRVLKVYGDTYGWLSYTPGKLNIFLGKIGFKIIDNSLVDEKAEVKGTRIKAIMMNISKMHINDFLARYKAKYGESVPQAQLERSLQNLNYKVVASSIIAPVTKPQNQVSVASTSSTSIPKKTDTSVDSFAKDNIEKMLRMINAEKLLVTALLERYNQTFYPTVSEEYLRKIIGTLPSTSFTACAQSIDYGEIDKSCLLFLKTVTSESRRGTTPAEIQVKFQESYQKPLLFYGSLQLALKRLDTLPLEMGSFEKCASNPSLSSGSTGISSISSSRFSLISQVEKRRASEKQMIRIKDILFTTGAMLYPRELKLAYEETFKEDLDFGADVDEFLLNILRKIEVVVESDGCGNIYIGSWHMLRKDNDFDVNHNSKTFSMESHIS